MDGQTDGWAVRGKGRGTDKAVLSESLADSLKIKMSTSRRTQNRPICLN